MKKGRIWIVIGFAAVLGMAGCGALSREKASTSSMEMAMDTSAMTAEAPSEAAFSEEYGDYETASGAAGDNGAAVTSSAGIESVTSTSQKLIKTVDMSMETKEFDTLLLGLTDKAAELGGYVETSEVNGNSYYGSGNRYAWLRLRIPADKLDGFVSIVSEMGNVTYKNEYVEDITLEYVDVESHKQALVIEQERLMELLENAENMEDIIQIETRLSEIRYELQSYESRLRTMDNQVNYSTVSVNISEVERMTEVEEKNFLEEVSYRLSNNFYDIGQGFRNFAIWFLSSLPYLVIWAVVLAGIVLAVRRVLTGKKEPLFRRRKKKDKQAEAEEEREKES